jgi:hypothetical protein
VDCTVIVEAHKYSSTIVSTVWIIPILPFDNVAATPLNGARNVRRPGDTVGSALIAALSLSHHPILPSRRRYRKSQNSQID